MNTIEKVMKLIKSDKQIAENLFLFSTFPTDVKLWTGIEEDNFDYTNIRWLFITDQQNHNLVGVNILENTIWSIDDEGEFRKACDSLPDLPYEMLRLECSFTNNGTVVDYFLKYQDEAYKETLERYEQWCKDNNIELDKNNIYHDAQGNLFKKSFYKN